MKISLQAQTLCTGTSIALHFGPSFSSAPRVSVLVERIKKAMKKKNDTVPSACENNEASSSVASSSQHRRLLYFYFLLSDKAESTKFDSSGEKCFQKHLK